MRISYAEEHQSVDPQAVDLSEPALYAVGDPHRIWRAMLEREPVLWQKSSRGGFWSVTRYADVSRVLKDHTRFSSEQGNLLDVLGKGDSSARRQLAATDPPRHTVMRAPIQRALAAPRIEPFYERMRAEARRLLGGVLASGSFDFASITGRYSIAITALVMGLDPNDLMGIGRFANGAMAPDDSEYQLGPDRDATMRQCHWEMFSYFDSVVSAKRHTVNDGGFIGQLIEMELEDGRRLADEEIISNCYSLMLGSNVATPHVVSGALIELVESATYDTWARRPDLLYSGVEEALRWASPATHFMRYCLEPRATVHRRQAPTTTEKRT